MKRFRSQIEKLWISERFPGCIREVYLSLGGNDMAMRNCVASVVSRNFEALWPKKEFKDLLSEGGDFVLDVMKIKIIDVV